MKDRPKKSRLTLKPDFHAGIFKHGRASAQVAGRRNGLPDLVFNEMRFLQRPSDHQDEMPKESDSAHTAKQGRKRHGNEEISAYFAEAEPQVTATANAPRVQELRDDRVLQPTVRQASRKDAVEPPVDLPEKPFLGYGSRSAARDSSATAPTNNSDLSWSESAGLPPNQKERKYSSGRLPVVVEETQANHGRNRAIVHRSREGLPLHDCTIDGHSNAAELTAENAACVPSRRANGPAVVEVYHTIERTPSWHDRSRDLVNDKSQHATQRTQHLASNAVRSKGDQQQSFNTSDILEIRQPPSTRQGRTPLVEWSPYNSSTVDDKENRDPESLSLTSKLLQKVQRAVIEDTSANVKSAAQNRLSRTTRSTRAQAHHLRLPSPDDPDVSAGSHAQQERSALPQRGLQTGSTVKTSRRPAPIESAHSRAANSLHSSIFAVDSLQRGRPVDEEKQDDQPDEPPIEWTSHRAHASTRHLEALVSGPPSSRAPGLYQTQAEHTCIARPTTPRRSNSFALDTNATRSQLFGFGDLARTPSIRGLSVDRELGDEQQHEPLEFGHLSGKAAANDEFAGFWKPHRLY
ncbi:hypothetical protein Tdes44962_MAKER01696 [Teratosphaeria destructans]|uniref:Uncharacterized protein n=1 Tax=Teratosphaeria destructans TaxID=418781 RepID=A0A9W7SXN8_9PEZI|nr:hypothetical protein Tdes44962_MAKER01696 [Teratosphaeria destructans]